MEAHIYTDSGGGGSPVPLSPDSRVALDERTVDISFVSASRQICVHSSGCILEERHIKFSSARKIIHNNIALQNCLLIPIDI